MSRFATGNEPDSASGAAALALVRALAGFLLDTKRLTLEELELIQQVALTDLSQERPAEYKVARELILEAFP